MVREGHVRFTFTVDAERHFDGLAFYVDGELIFGIISVQRTFREVTLPLEVGHHVLLWKFVKDISRSQGEDVAAIEVRLD